METLGIDVGRIRAQQQPKPESSFLKFETEAYSLDCLPRIAGLGSFREVERRSSISDALGIDIPVLSLEDLLTNKTHTAREKDLRDVEELKRINGLD